MRETTTRRGFLGMFGVAGAAAVTLGTAVRADAKPHRKTFPGILVFRLQTRGHRTCRACASHHRFMVFRTHALADAHRAHPGCNCPIVRHKMPTKEFARLFGTKGRAPGGVADLRHVSLHRAAVATS